MSFGQKLRRDRRSAGRLLWTWFLATMDGIVSRSASNVVAVLAIAVGVVTSSTACSDGGDGGRSTGALPSESIIRIAGSDTMVNVVQAWAESYKQVRPAVSVQVAGGGSGVGIAALTEGVVDIAAAGREMKADEMNRAQAHNGTRPQEFTVALRGHH